MGCVPKFLRFKFRCRPTNQVVAGGDDDKGIVKRKSHEKEMEKDYDEHDEGCVKKYSWKEIERITVNFSRVIGSGGFGTVYLAHLPGSNLGAVKIHGASEHLSQVFKQELDILRRLRHDNIVKLLGYCDDQEEGALLFEYVPNGSLQEKLHGAERESEKEEREDEKESSLPWRSRMAIAFQLAKALEYLHEKCALQIVHGDIKSSNILLDEHLNCKVCDFGSAKMGFSSMVIMPSSRRKQRLMMMGSPGYADPHYLRTGIASKKNDVYSYGVILLELVTGMAAFCQESDQPLTSIMRPILKNAHECEAAKVAEMVDPRLAGDFDLKEARDMLSISALCLVQSPALRPSASQILDTIKDNIPSISFLFSADKISL